MPLSRTTSRSRTPARVQLRLAPFVALLAGLAVLVGCGADEEASTATPTAARTPAAATTPDKDEFLVLANQVCRTVREAAPVEPAADAATSAVRAYAEAAAPVDRATAQSLRRLPTPEALRNEVDGLANAYAEQARTIKALGTAAPKGKTADALRAKLRTTQSAIQAQATATGLPGCVAVSAG